MGKQAKEVLTDGDFHVYTKQLSGGEVAVGIFNLGERNSEYSLSVREILPNTDNVVDAWKIEQMPFDGENTSG